MSSVKVLVPGGKAQGDVDLPPLDFGNERGRLLAMQFDFHRRQPGRIIGSADVERQAASAGHHWKRESLRR